VPLDRRRGPGKVITPRQGQSVEIRHDTDTDMAIVPHDAGDVAAELIAWGSTLLHLHSLGLPAAVPSFLLPGFGAAASAPTW